MSNLFEYSEADFYIFHARDDHPQPESFRMHAHTDPEILCFLGGKGSYRIEGTVYPLRVGDILIMRTAETHMLQIDPSEPYERLVFNIRPEYLDSIDPSGALWRMFFDRPLGSRNRYRIPSAAREDFFDFLSQVREPGTPVRTALLAKLYTILTEAAVLYEKCADTPPKLSSHSLAQDIIRYLNSHLGESISLEEIAAHFYLSRSQLCRVFKEATGSGVIEYIRIKRLMAAREQIAAGTPAARAAAACGFGDYSSFYRAYKARFGIPPGKANINK